VSVFERRFVDTAIWGWCIFAVILFGLMLWQPGRSLFQTYADASYQFWAGIVPPADFKTGYYYLPISQILYTPFALLGDRIGGVSLQIAGVGLTTLAAWELARLLVPDRTRFAFAIILLLIIAGVAGILRTAQLDSLMWPLTACAAAAIGRGKFWAAAGILSLAFAIKPTAIVALLLMGVTWPGVGLRLVPLVIAVIFLPVLATDWDFVRRLYVSLAERITGAVAEPRNWNDLGNLLAYVGLPVPFAIMMTVRAVAAVATLIPAWAARRRLPPPLAAFSVFALASLYLLLFNPRTEGGGYAGLSLVAAPLAARMFLLEGRAYSGALLAAVCLLMGLPGLTPGTMRLFEIWMKPSLGIAVTILVLIPRAFDARRWEPGRARISEETAPILR
jgi:hypothetical protein